MIGSSIFYSTKLFLHNIQIALEPIDITFILFAIAFINENCIRMNNLQSYYNFICHYIVIVLLCVVLIGCVLVYFIETDANTDNIYIYCENYYGDEQSITQQLQFNIEDHIVNNCVFCWHNCAMCMMIRVIYVYAIYLTD